MRVAPNTNKQRPQSGLCERGIRREANETEGLVHKLYNLLNRDLRYKRPIYYLKILDDGCVRSPLLCFPINSIYDNFLVRNIVVRLYQFYKTMIYYYYFGVSIEIVMKVRLLHTSVLYSHL